MNGYRWISGFHDYQRVCKNMQMRDVDTIEAFPFQVLELLSLSLVSTEIGAECLGTWVDRESHVYAHCCWLNSCSIAILVNSVCWTILGLLPCVCAALPCMTIQNRNFATFICHRFVTHLASKLGAPKMEEESDECIFEYKSEPTLA